MVERMSHWDSNAERAHPPSELSASGASSVIVMVEEYDAGAPSTVTLMPPEAAPNPTTAASFEDGEDSDGP